MDALALSSRRLKLKSIFASNTRSTVVRGSNLEEGESQGVAVWVARIGDLLLASNLTRRVDFALFMVAALENDAQIRQTAAIVGCQTPSAIHNGAFNRDRGQVSE